MKTASYPRVFWNAVPTAMFEPAPGLGPLTLLVAVGTVTIFPVKTTEPVPLAFTLTFPFVSIALTVFPLIEILSVLTSPVPLGERTRFPLVSVVEIVLPEIDTFPPIRVVAVSDVTVGVLLIDIIAEPLDIQTPVASAGGSVHIGLTDVDPDLNPEY